MKKAVIVLSTAFLWAVLISEACAQIPSRPQGVPPEATYVRFSQVGGWVHCWLDESAKINRCRLYDPKGMRILPIGHERDEDDVFLRYDGGVPVSNAALEIDTVRTQQSYVWLRNGIILLPRSDFDFQSDVIERNLRLLDAADIKTLFGGVLPQRAKRSRAPIQ